MMPAMRLVVATLAVLLVAIAPAGAAAGLTRSKAERLVEHRVKARYGDTARAECERRSRRSHTCTWTSTFSRAQRTDGCTPSRSGDATIVRRAGHTVVRLRNPVAVLCDSGG
jgi:hypothetical protein